MAKKPAESKQLPNTVSTAQLSRLCGCTTRTIQLLADKEIGLKKLAHGKFELVPSVQAYFAYQTEVAVSRVKTPDNPVEIERVRRLKRENDEAERNLIKVDEAEAVLSAIIGPIQTELGFIPAQVTDDLEIRDRIENEIDKVLNSIATRFRKIGQSLRTGSDPFAEISEGNSLAMGQETDLSANDGQAGTA